MGTSEKKRSLLDRITNRDIIVEQTRIITDKSKQLEALEGVAQKVQALEGIAQKALDGKTLEDLQTGMDSYWETEGAAIRIPVTHMGRGAKFGEKILDSNRLFASLREPIGYRIVDSVAEDIWDNWFVAEDLDEKKGDKDLDKNTQKALLDLGCKQVLVRATKFERRYGWSIIVLAYDDDKDLAEPLPDKEKRGDLMIRMIEPYPKTKVMEVITVSSKDIGTKDKEGVEPAERLGMPRYYIIDRSGDGASTGTKVHWSRVIHDAPRLDEHKWKGVSVLDPIYDDITVFRNMRWGMGQTIYRVGSGFPVITLKGAKEKDIKRYHDEGKFADLCARTYLVKNENEIIEFLGAQGAALNPAPYYEAELEQLSIGTRIPKAILRGAQAGSLTGSEVNRKEYGKFISSEQSAVEPIIRELIDRLIETGQIETKADYKIAWVDPYTVGERDQALIEMTTSITRKNLLQYMMIDEVRKLDDLEELPGGEGKIILPLEQMKAKAQAPGLMGPGSPFSSRVDQTAKPPFFTETLLETEFDKIWSKVARGDLDRETAMEEAGKILDQFIEKSEQMALARLQQITGQTITEESPEGQVLRDEERKYYMSWFSKILDDILEKKE